MATKNIWWRKSGVLIEYINYQGEVLDKTDYGTHAFGNKKETVSIILCNMSKQTFKHLSMYRLKLSGKT